MQAVNSINEIHTSVTRNTTLVATDGSKIDGSAIQIGYDTDRLKRLRNNTYLVQPPNIEKSLRDILSLNSPLEDAPKKYKGFPKRQILPPNLYFNEKIINGRVMHCNLAFAPMTKTGKLPKYPAALNFAVDDSFFGSLSYTSGGNIGKATIIAWVKNVCYELNLSGDSSGFVISSIHKNTIGESKRKVYSSK